MFRGLGRFYATHPFAAMLGGLIVAMVSVSAVIAVIGAIVEGPPRKPATQPVAAVVSEAELERQRREEEERKQREEQERRANIEWQKRQAEEAEKEWKRRLAARQSAVSQCLTEVDGYPNTPGLRRGIMDAYLDQNGQIHGFGTPEGFYRWTKCVTLRGYPELGMEPEKRK